MSVEKEYYQDMNKTWSDCLIAANNDKTLAVEFFKMAMSPHYYWLQNREMQINQGPQVTIFLTDGELKTIDYKDQIKKEGFRWNKDTYSWSRTFLVKDWNVMSKTSPFDKLHIEIKEEKK